jgi:heme/copper-type cytochrome/quinol oxidase subunit 1
VKRFIQPGFLFAISGIFIIILLSYSSKGEIDIPIHDTYFVIDKLHFSFILGAPFFFIAFFYFLFEKLNMPLYKTPGFIHYGATVLFVMIIFFPMPILRYYPNSNEIFTSNERLNTIVTGAFILSILAQFIFVINIFASLFKNRKT